VIYGSCAREARHTHLTTPHLTLPSPAAEGSQQQDIHGRTACDYLSRGNPRCSTFH
jgi:hypothetical protein